MKVHIENEILSSFAVLVDNTLQDKAEGYTNHSSELYDVKDQFNGYYSYGLPYKQIASDISVSGADVMSGVWVDNVFQHPGEGDLVAIDHQNGKLHFSSNQDSATISGEYAVKDFNIYLTEEPEDRILFETKYHTNPKTTQTPAGLAPNIKTIPAVFLRLNGGENTPFCLGGTDRSEVNIKAVVLARDAYELDSVCGYMKDIVRKHIPFVTPADLPFGALGYTGEAFNYDNFTGNVAGTPFISSSFASKIIMNQDDYKDLSSNVYGGIIDYEIETFRDPRA